MSRLPASPYFFRPVKRAFVGGILLLLLVAAIVPAPLDVPADPANPPNPAKSAWFLLWIQEMVSWNTMAIYGALLLAVTLIALPWFRRAPVEHAGWFQREERLAGVLALLTFLALVALTVIGLYFRGLDWSLVAPF